MGERQNPEQSSAVSSPLSISECDARDMIAALSHRTMCDRAVRHVFASPPDPALRVILEFMPAIRIRYGFVSTAKLSQILTAELGIKERQALRGIQRAVDGKWILPRVYQTDKRCTDNVYNPEKNVPELLRRLTDLYVEIGGVVRAQLLTPLNVSVGRDRLPAEVFMHPVSFLQAKHADTLTSEQRSAL